jgi:dihydropteroate synthase/2-amino-4-hydroxy-6-hydroxymethyldihydropteridine diphosphokinase
MNSSDYIYIALGSNLADRERNFVRAIGLLVENGIELIETSPLYITPAILLNGSPSEWNIPYYNAIIKVDTSIAPQDLLKLCKKIEGEIGHNFTERWAPRLIDLDIVYYKGFQVNEENLVIPHKEFHNRGFWHDALSFICPEIAEARYEKGHQPLVMGILNVTPDSFSDGGIYNNPSNFKRAFDLWNKKNTHIIDIGSVSTRPGAKQLDFKIEQKRLSFVFDYLKQYKRKKYFNSLLSIDTFNPETAQLAINNGFSIVNDVSGMNNPAMVELAQSYRSVKFVFMHSLTVPVDKNVVIPNNVDVLEEVAHWLNGKLETFDKVGIKKEQLIFDFGLGFGKTASQSLRLLQNIDVFRRKGIKIMLAHSRKSFMKVFGDEENRDVETLSLSSKLYNKVDILRVHTPLEHQRMILASEHTNEQCF